MKLQISERIDQCIEGYTIIPIVYGKLDIGMTPNNSATHILAHDALDSVPSELLVEFLSSIIQKMRYGCEITIGGTELSSVAKDVITYKVSTPEFNDLVYKKRGLYRCIDIINLLTDAKLQILSSQIKGRNYEITAVRNPD